MLLASGYSAEDATVMLKEAMTEESHVNNDAGSERYGEIF